MPKILRTDPLILLSDDKRRVAIEASVDGRIEVLTNAKRQILNGRDMWVMDYSLDNFIHAHVLRIPLPAPIRHRYTWCGRYKPMAHQMTTAAFCTRYERLFVLNEIGTGKTLSALWAADFLMREGAIKKCVILSTLSTLNPVWGAEIFQHFPHRRFFILHGAAKKRVTQTADFYIMNHDGLRNAALLSALTADPDIGLVIVDEAALLRNSRTARYKALSQLLRTVPRAWLLTATPTPNNPTDAWAQARLVNPVAVPRFFPAFQDLVMRKEGPFRMVARPEAPAIVHRVMQPAIRFTAAQCLDLPPISHLSRHADMSPQQAALYEHMRKTLTAEVKGHLITAANEAVKANKLLQVACGVLLSDEKVHAVHAPAKITVLLELMEQATGPVVIFAPYTAVVAYIRERLVAAKYRVESVTGAVGRGARDTIFSEFQRGNIDALVAHPGTMSHGLTLTASHLMIWYGPVWSNDTYEQAIGRLYRQGQTQHVNIVHLESSTIETEMYARLRERRHMQGVLLKLFASDDELTPPVDAPMGIAYNH